MLLASHALAAGPLAASQPGFTVLDPLWAGLLGVFLFGEHIQASPWDLAGEALALALVIAGAWGLSHSCFILGEFGDPSCLPAGFQAQARGKKLPDAEQLGSWPAEQRKAELPGTGDDLVRRTEVFGEEQPSGSPAGQGDRPPKADRRTAANAGRAGARLASRVGMPAVVCVRQAGRSSGAV